MKNKIEALFELKNQMDELNRTLKEMKSTFDDLSMEIIGDLDQQGVDKMAIKGVGSVTARTEVVASVEDWDAFYAHIKANDAWYLLQRRPAVNACREAWQIGDDLPGVKPFQQVKLGLAKARG